MSLQPLLIELLTEELPPKALSKLGDSFAESIFQSLKKDGVLSNSSTCTKFATPRRLAVLITDVLSQAPQQRRREKLLPVSIGLDANGQASAPLIKKLSSLGIEQVNLAQLERDGEGKNETFYIQLDQAGLSLTDAAQQAINTCLSKLPIPKVMRYQIDAGTAQAVDVQFVRPAHHLIVMHGSEVLPVHALGLKSSNTTLGHRFLSDGSLTIKHATEYETTLESSGKVIADFDKRLNQMKLALNEKAQGHQVLMPQSLLEEVCSLVEWPVVYDCSFEKEFLDVPQECLILTMQTNQKYFALTDQKGKLVNQFLIVSNIETKTPDAIISGNERVVRPRLADAKFFFEQDKKKALKDRIKDLSKVVYHNKLGTQLERSERVQTIALWIANELFANQSQITQDTQRAAEIAKCDLLTDMVGEFPELQGIMGRYYAHHDGESAEVAQACMEHYFPRFAGDQLPQSQVGTVLALADKIETIVGIWGIGLAPTGEKDPFALRRHALGICRILIEKQLPLKVQNLLEIAKATFKQAEVQDNAQLHEIYQFILDRLKAYLKDQASDGKNYTSQEIDAVVSLNPNILADLLQRLAAVRAFAQLPEAEALAAANKRIGNILKKVDGQTPSSVNPTLFQEAAEKSLYQALETIEPQARAALQKGEYAQALKAFASIRAATDQFFADVMVMCPDEKLKNNRIALLHQLHTLMNQVADISKLAN